MAAKDPTSTITDFVSSFQRKAPAAPADIPTADLSPRPATPMHALPPSDGAAVVPTAALAPVPTLPREGAESAPTLPDRPDAAPAEQAGRINYAATFLVPVRSRKAKAVYITEDAHRTLNAIIQASDGTPLADLLGNIVSHHFATYGPDIRAFLADQEKKNKKRLLI